MSHSFFKRLREDEEGSITAFVILMFLIMLVGGGMAVDFMRHESERAVLQDALDRGVLAAASFDQEDHNMDLNLVVRSYVSANPLLNDRYPNLNVESNVTVYSRSVTASGSYEINTYFLKIIGMNTLNIHAAASAQTTRGEVEISLILDNSGSMSGPKLQDLKNAANSFIDLMLNEETIDHTTISLVPFTASVNAGSVLSSRYNLDVWHDYSSCFEFADSDFSSTSLSTTSEFPQEQHVNRGRVGTRECPDSPIVPLSNNPDVLHAAINNMNAGGFTATYAGMKWGAALLDPDSQPVVTSLIELNAVDPVFAGRPIAWDDNDAAKFIILMTDGANTEHMRLTPDVYNAMNTVNWESQANADYWNGRTIYYLERDSVFEVTPTRGDDRLIDICNAAKEDIPGSNRDRIIVFTIGFNVRANSNPYNMMRDCASSESKFYHVSDADLTTAFAQIASSITKLKLTN